MRIQTQARLCATLICACIFCLSTVEGGSQSNPVPPVIEPSTVEKGLQLPEVLLTPQQLQEQHQQLLKAIELIRQDTQGYFQRHATAVERIRKDTDASLKRFTTAVDRKMDRLNLAVASERE